MASRAPKWVPDEVLEEISVKMGTGEEVLQLILGNVPPRRLTPRYIERHFEDVLSDLMRRGDRMLRLRRRRAARALVYHTQKYWKSGQSQRGDELFWYGVTSFANQSRKRAGVHLEVCVDELLERLHIPREPGKEKLRRIDFVCPNNDVWNDDPGHAVLVETKNSLGERWKEVQDMAAVVKRDVWLLTLGYVSPEVAKKIWEANILLFVPRCVFEDFPRRTKHRPQPLSRFIPRLRSHLRGSGARFVPRV